MGGFERAQFEDAWLRYPPPVPEPGTVILVRQYRPAIGRWMWDVFLVRAP